MARRTTKAKAATPAAAAESDELARAIAKLRAAAAARPGIEPGTSHGRPVLKINGKWLASVKDKSTLVLTCALEEKELLLAAAPTIYFETDHYKGWPAILARASKIRKAELAHRLERTWRMKAPRRLVKSFDEGRQRPSDVTAIRLRR